MAKRSIKTEPVFDEKLLQKKVFVRAFNPSLAELFANSISTINEYREAQLPRKKYSVVSQDQFLEELDPRSHKINNPTIYPNKRVKEKRKVDGKDVEYYRETQIARISLPLQELIAMRQTVHLWANPPKFTAQRKSDSELFARFKEYWKEKNASSAIYLMAKSVKTTGDGAICFFLTDTGLKYKVWSYADGDQLIPVYKENGIDMKMFIRRYYSVPDGYDNAMDTIDVYTDKTYKQLIKDGTDWKVIIPERPHGFFQIPVAYHRENDVAWGQGQELIETIELFLSNVRESGSYFAFGILFLKGDDVEVLPTKETQGKVIISQDPQGDAKMLEQTDMSASLKFEFEQYTKSLFRSTGTVIIDPEILKGGDQSGAYIKNLYNDAVQYALDSKPKWQPVLEKTVSIVKEALGLEERDTLNYKNLVVISEPDIYVPMNIAEDIRLVNESLTAGTISEQTASEVHKLAAPDEMQRLEKQNQEATAKDIALVQAKNKNTLIPQSTN